MWKIKSKRRGGAIVEGIKIFFSSIRSTTKTKNNMVDPTMIGGAALVAAAFGYFQAGASC